MAITVSIAMSIVFILSIERHGSGTAHVVRRRLQPLVRLLFVRDRIEYIESVIILG